MSMLSGPPALSPFPIFRRLRTHSDFSSLGDNELLELINTSSPKGIAQKQKIVARLMAKCGVHKLEEMISDRNASRRREVGERVPESERRAREKAFGIVWAKAACVELERIQFNVPLQCTEIVSDKQIFLECLSHLLDKQPTTAKTSKPLPLPKPTKASQLKAAATAESLEKTQSSASLSSVATETFDSIPSMHTTTPQSQDLGPVSPVPPARQHKVQQAFTTSRSKAGGQSIEERLLHLERELEVEREARAALSRDYDALRAAHDQLINEAGKERYDKQRVVLLKSMLIQLERQVLAMEDTVQLRENLVYDLLDHMNNLKETLNDVLTSTSDVPDSVQSSFKHTIAHLNQVQAYMRSNSQKFDMEATVDKLPGLHMVSEFVLDGKKVKAQDVARGEIDHLNLEHVGRLEEQLHALFGELTKLKTTLETSIAPRLPASEKQHLLSTFNTALTSLTQSCSSLLNLSILVPSAPTPSLQSLNLHPLPTYDELSQKLPKLSTTQRPVIEGLLKTLDKQIRGYKKLRDDEVQGLKEELGTYRSFSGDTESLRQKLKQETHVKQSQFHEKLREDIKPHIEEMSDNLKELKSEFSKDRLVRFLKDTENGLDSVLSAIERWEIS